MLFPKRNGFIPRVGRGTHKRFVRAGGSVKWHRQDAQPLVTAGFALSCQLVIFHHPQHVLGIFLIIWKSTNFASHFGRCGIGNAGHHRRDRPANGTALVTVIGMACRHQQTANIGKAQPQGPILIG